MSSQSSSVYRLIETPVLFLAVAAGSKGIVGVTMAPDPEKLVRQLDPQWIRAGAGENPVLDEAVSQLGEYFWGKRRVFDLPLDLAALTSFRRSVLKVLSDTVPYGATCTYTELARRCGSPRAARGVGGAMAANPVPVIIPCHRVVGAHNRLVGYSGGQGIASKRWLLDLEKNGLASNGECGCALPRPDA
jgi:methylated-DNA-[protein]-cysteine S-methyltransferase